MHFGERDVREALRRIGRHFARKIMFAVDADIVVNKIAVVKAAHIGADYFRVIGHDRAVVMVVAEMFVKVIRHAGVENIFDPCVHQRLHMAVHQLRGEAYRVGGNGGLTFDVKFAARKRGENDFKTELCEKRMPERQQFIHVQPHRNADLSARALDGEIGAQKVQLIGVHVELSSAGALCHRFFTAVAADEAPVPAEDIDGQAAVVAAQTAVGHFYFMLEVFKLVLSDRCELFPVDFFMA